MMAGLSLEHVKARLLELGYQGEPTPEILRQYGWVPDDPLASVDLSGPIRTKEQLMDDLALLKVQFLGAVISNASAFRYEDDVPILVPGVNLEHTKLIDLQRSGRKWKGYITPLPNCTTTGLVMTLKPILDRFGIERVIMTSPI